jgi:integrase
VTLFSDLRNQNLGLFTKAARMAQRYGLIPRNQESNPMRFVRCKTTSGYEALILTPKQAYAVLACLPEPERTLTLLAAGTGLRISECLGLQLARRQFC